MEYSVMDQEILAHFSSYFDQGQVRHIPASDGCFAEFSKRYPAAGSAVDWRKVDGVVVREMMDVYDAS